MLLDILQAAAEPVAAASSPIDLLYILIPSLFGGYGIATIISHFTKRSTAKGAQQLEGTRLGQDIMEKALLRLDKELAELRGRDDAREQELAIAQKTNAALVRYLVKFINYIKLQGGNVPLIDPEDEPYLTELSTFAKTDNDG